MQQVLPVAPSSPFSLVLFSKGDAYIRHPDVSETYISWRVPLVAACRCGSANSAMFAEIVPEQLRSVVYAFDRSFEGAIAACAAPLVGGLLPFGLLSSCHNSFHSDERPHLS